MLFRSSFHAGIRAGTITVTYRRWSRPMARIGARHTVPPIGVVEITAIDAMPLGHVGDAEAIAAGYASLAGLTRELDRFAPATATAATEIYRVKFRYVGPMPVAAPDVTADDAIDTIVAKLDRMDARSEDGPWTGPVLQLIADRPGVVSTRLAPLVKRERLEFKALVRRLKALGLTRSLPVGYEITATGTRVLARRGSTPS